MKLELDELDLKLEHRDLPTRAIKLEHFTPEAQAAIKAVGRSLFYRNRGTHLENYNAVWCAYIGPGGSEIEVVPTVLGVTLDDRQWVAFMNTVTEDWVREHIAKSYSGRVIAEIQWDAQP